MRGPVQEDPPTSSNHDIKGGYGGTTNISIFQTRIFISF
jgi:hypothetical protein